LKYYVRTVDELESLLHIDMFSNLSDSVEEDIESKCNRSIWGI
jgi:DNA/RNA endonuclease G (NUC1)